MIADGQIPSVRSRAELRTAIPAMLQAKPSKSGYQVTRAAERIAEFINTRLAG
jgi:hypothetical protein